MWNSRPVEALESSDSLRAELLAALQEGRAHELVLFTGQTVGLIDEVLPVAEVVPRLVADAEAILRDAPTLL